jgi:hypothetical protein
MKPCHETITAIAQKPGTREQDAVGELSPGDRRKHSSNQDVKTDWGEVHSLTPTPLIGQKDEPGQVTSRPNFTFTTFSDAAAAAAGYCDECQGKGACSTHVSQPVCSTGNANKTKFNESTTTCEFSRPLAAPWARKTPSTLMQFWWAFANQS